MACVRAFSAYLLVMSFIEPSYLQLPEAFYAKVSPSALPEPKRIAYNSALAQAWGLGELDREALRGSKGTTPLALAYSGHQFGVFVPLLGDGRAILIGEAENAQGQRADLHLKGAGRTPFSRNGDGRAALGPVMREYLLSEAMAALGVPTSRALAAYTTGEVIMRDGPRYGAALVRLASSHLRIGTFQYAARLGPEALAALVDFALQRHFPAHAKAEVPALALLDSVVARQAELVAAWLLVGFIHGVMNSDNSMISGETLDYGPAAFLDSYDPQKVFSSIDHQGRYAYGNQPQIAQWNLAKLAQTLLPLINTREAEALQLAQTSVDRFAPRFETAYLSGMRRKLGLVQEAPEDAALARDLLDQMAEAKADFTNSFRRLADAVEQDPEPLAFLKDWLPRWRARLEQEKRRPSEIATSLTEANPQFIPRNHQVQQAIRDAEETQSFDRFHRLLSVWQRPYDAQPEASDLTLPPSAEEEVRVTFCGT